MEDSDGALLKQPFVVALIVGTLLEAFGGIMFTGGGVFANPGLILFGAGTCADLAGALLWFRARR